MNSDTHEVTDSMPVAMQQKQYTLKVLFGPMFGCELHLPANDYFLIINPGPELQDSRTEHDADNHAAAYTHNTLYLPCNTPSPNIILRLSSSVEEEGGICPGYRIDILDEVENYSSILSENEVFTHQHIRFAIKRSESDWSEYIKNFVIAPTLDIGFSHTETLYGFNYRKNAALIIGSLILIFLMIIAGIIWYKKTEREQQVLSLNEVLIGVPTPVKIIRSRDKKMIYVLANQYQAMEWAQEAIFKIQGINNVRPIWLPKLKKEIINQLGNAGYPVLQIDYTIPQHPVLALWENLSSQQQQALRSMALKKIPFAIDIKMVVRTKNQLLQDARHGLDRLHIYYRQIDTATGYALVVRDALSDTTLAALNKFIKNFNQQWGEQVINFSINLNENWLQNKSYVDSSNGYLFLNPRHWYFSIKHGDKNV
ncbi:PrgH/EprH family type III secretion apparatus protein [Klebsiella aerogenes]|uniref:PrgH/EprH family type III secretion apparatus protein n=1 Tax=Klebsiella aerogenes TaxID=548 RepID=UPI00063C85CE|nr:PrgH/EprH family type III secretion apparatus protein [Klebsiella aerogenes]ELA0086660.1 PrgH/EprH family type III secretion apparatus protein [Klebsiella aerogenes]KLF56255.1 type III secretion system protein [Klebsiella aerogenes]HBR7000857.1 PrgH/EprH family type III secretion apparatus protein [Klebsiella aerogenes]HDS6527702.1 PrgH/EprH family type III secretion apparatus protein [Klebsiella aerogenes]